MSPSNSMNESVGEDTQEECNCMCEGKTISQLQDICNYIQDLISKLRNVAENDITIEQFEDIKKQDLDGDGGKGEAHGY